MLHINKHLDKYLPSIIQYGEFINNTPTIHNFIIDKFSGMDMHINDIDEAEKERKLIDKIIKQKYFSEVLDILESNHSNNYKLQEIQKILFIEENNDKPRPFNLKSGGLFKNWEDDTLIE
jgi:hypothetical protein